MDGGYRRGGTEINDSPSQQYSNSNEQDYAWDVNQLPAHSSACKTQKVVWSMQGGRKVQGGEKVQKTGKFKGFFAVNVILYNIFFMLLHF